MRLALRISGFVVCVIGLNVMPNGPWYREMGAMLLILWSSQLHDLADNTPRAGTVHELSKAR